jgi:hypothetical protein
MICRQNWEIDSFSSQQIPGIKSQTSRGRHCISCEQRLNLAYVISYRLGRVSRGSNLILPCDFGYCFGFYSKNMSLTVHLWFELCLNKIAKAVHI